MQSKYDQWIRQILSVCDIPERYHDMMHAIILIIADNPDCTLLHACRIYAEQHHTTEQSVYRSFRHAVNLGWEAAVTPSSLLYSRRMSPEEFVQTIISRLG